MKNTLTEEVKNMKKKIILLTTITSILVTLLIVVGIVNASNSKNYLV